VLVLLLLYPSFASAHKVEKETVSAAFKRHGHKKSVYREFPRMAPVSGSLAPYTLSPQPETGQVIILLLLSDTGQFPD